MSYVPSQVVYGGETDMLNISQVNGSWAAGVRAFIIFIYDMDTSNNAETPTLRLNDGSLHTTGYDRARFDKTNGSTYSQEAFSVLTNQTWLDPFGLNNTGEWWGYWEGYCVSVASDIWNIRGKFHDDSVDRSEIEIFGQVTIDNPCVGFRVQSSNAGNWEGGTLAWQAWT